MDSIQQTPKKNNKAAVVVLIVLGLIFIGMIGAGSQGINNTAKTSQSPDSEVAGATSPAAKPALPKVGQPARDGKFEFVVSGLECGKTSVGSNQYLTKTAQGQYCLMKVNVKNVGNEKQTLSSSYQKLIDAANKEYSADDMATIYVAPQDKSSWYNDINPGNSVEGTIVFDVPKDVKPIVAELHDSLFSGGIKVDLQ